jgi:phosphonate transport system permease protein
VSAPGCERPWDEQAPRRQRNLPLPPPLFDARCKACWFTAGLLVLVVASFWSLDLQWAQFLSLDALRSMGRFLGEFFPPDTSPEFLQKVALGAWETLAMSALGTGLAAVAGLALALPASRLYEGHPALARSPTRLILNACAASPNWCGPRCC